MANIDSWVENARQEGYSTLYASAKVCQDIVLKAIAASDFGGHITIKGGVVMRSITGNIRRATRDLDLDFIRYSLDEESIRHFIDRLNCLDGITIRMAAPIEELSQQEYRGKRVFVVIEDDTGHSLRSKIDLGVHKQVQVEQDEYCFDICMDDEGVSLLINSKEQIFTEKLRSLLRFGPLSTRYKDVFDLCYLAGRMDMERLTRCLDVYILSDPGMRETSMEAIRRRLHLTFRDRTYRQRLEQAASANWLNAGISEVFEQIETFLRGIEDP